MFNMDFASRALGRALQALTAVIALLVAFLVMTLVSSVRAEDKSSFTAEVIRLVNEERAKAGVPGLQEAADLIPAADLRAIEASSKFSHTRPNGSKWKTVFNEFEIQASFHGENLAYGQKSPKAVVKAWMASEGHRKNILNGAFDHIAVGMYEKKGVLYWSQLLIQAPDSHFADSAERGAARAGAPVTAGSNAQVTGVDLNVRANASAKAKVVAVAEEGSALAVLQVEEGWAYVQMNDGTEGWVSMKYLAA